MYSLAFPYSCFFSLASPCRCTYCQMNQKWIFSFHFSRYRSDPNVNSTKINQCECLTILNLLDYTNIWFRFIHVYIYQGNEKQTKLSATKQWSVGVWATMDRKSVIDFKYFRYIALTIHTRIYYFLFFSSNWFAYFLFIFSLQCYGVLKYTDHCLQYRSICVKMTVIILTIH